MIQALAMLFTVALSGSGSVTSTGAADYGRAIDCAAGEATLAALLGGENAQSADQETVNRLNALSGHWLQTALATARNHNAVRADLARSKTALVNALATAPDPASLSAMLDARLAGCAAPVMADTTGT